VRSRESRSSRSMRTRTACARLIVAVSWLALAVVHASGQAAATRDVRQLGQAFVDLLARGQFAEAARSFDETMTRLVPPAKLEQFWASLAGSSGAFKERDGARRYRLRAPLRETDAVRNSLIPSRIQIPA